MFESMHYDDGRGRYPARVAAHVSRELRANAQAVAAKRGVSIAELARQALTNEVRRDAGSPSIQQVSAGGSSLASGEES